MNVWYKARHANWGERIEPVQVDRASESSVWVGGRRHARMSDFHSFHEEWQAAKDHLASIAREKVNEATRQLDRLKRELDAVNALSRATGEGEGHD